MNKSQLIKQSNLNNLVKSASWEDHVKPFNTTQDAALGVAIGGLVGGAGSFALDTLGNAFKDKKKTFKEKLYSAIAPALISAGIGGVGGAAASKVGKSILSQGIEEGSKDLRPRTGGFVGPEKQMSKDYLNNVSLTELSDPVTRGVQDLENEMNKNRNVISPQYGLKRADIILDNIDILKRGLKSP